MVVTSVAPAGFENTGLIVDFDTLTLKIKQLADGMTARNGDSSKGTVFSL